MSLLDVDGKRVWCYQEAGIGLEVITLDLLVDGYTQGQIVEHFKDENIEISQAKVSRIKKKFVDDNTITDQKPPRYTQSGTVWRSNISE